MKKIVLLFGFLLTCAQVNAQSICDKAFNKAKSLYRLEKFSDAKEQFLKVINTKDCNSYKELAEEYVLLCDAQIRFASDKVASGANKFVLDEFNKDSREMERLRDRALQLEKDNEGYRSDNGRLRRIIDRKADSLLLLQDSIDGLLASIEFMEQDNEDLVHVKDSLKVLGHELNDYLRTVRWRNKKKNFVNCDMQPDISDMIEVMRSNIRLASTKKKK